MRYMTKLPDPAIDDIAKALTAYQMRLMLLPKEPYVNAMGRIHSWKTLWDGTVFIMVPSQIELAPLCTSLAERLECLKQEVESLSLPRSTSGEKFHVGCRHTGTLRISARPYTIGVINVHVGEVSRDPTLRFLTNELLPKEYILDWNICIPAPLHFSWTDEYSPYYGVCS